ncbi:hypothetical protein Tco_1577956 [Tanacetum coccineum]
MRINPAKTQKEPTYQVVLDALALTTCYHAFLITIDVPEIYMHQFWFTINKHDSSYRFKIGKKRFTLNVEVFREIFQICPKLPNQEFDALPLDEEIISLIKELGHKGDIKSITEVLVDQMGMFYKRNVDFVELLWEDFTFQIENRDTKKQEKMYYPRFTKKMRNSPAYKTYLAYATGAATPKKARKFKKPSSPSKKRTLVTVEEEEPEPAKKVKKAPATTDRSKGINLLSEAALLEVAQVKKVLKRSQRETTIHQAGGSGDGVGFQPKVPDEPKGKSVDTHEGTGLKLGIPNVSKAYSSESEYESWGVSGDEANVQGEDEDVQDSDDDPQQADDERTDFENQETNDDEEESDNKFVHTPEDYVPNDDETNDETKNVDEEEYERIKATTSTITVPESETLSSIHQRITDLEKDVKKLKNVNNSTTVISTIKSEVPNAVKECLGSSLDDALYKSVNKIPKHGALYHALIESILKDEDAMDKGVANELKKSKTDDADKDEGPTAGSY